VTDVPRRSYPLVVAPPGGFEDAVRRGRHIRRRRAGGGTGVAMLLVGALAYSVVGHGSGTASLDPARQPRIDRHVPAGDETTSPSATPSATGSHPPGTTTAVPGTHGGGNPQASAPAQPQATPTLDHRPGPAGLPYAHRNKINVSAPFANTNTNCLATTDNPDWCAYAAVTVGSATSYTLEYTLCKTVNKGGHLVYDRTQHADFAAIDVAHNDTVWTYSAGQPVVPDGGGDDLAGGYCLTWSVVWDGYDDFSRNPPPGSYRLVARSLAEGALPTATVDFTHQ
jgi:hypothetical protein